MDIFAYIAIATAASAATVDLKEHRIPNKLVFPVMLVGLLGHSLFNGVGGLGFSALGWAVGLLVFLVPFAIRMMGAGDVKLMAAIGSLMGWRFILITALYASIAGFFVALVIMAKKKGWMVRGLRCLPPNISTWLMPKVTDRPNILNEETVEVDDSDKKERTMVPYGLCIAMGVFLVLVGQKIGGWPLIHWIGY